MKSHLYIIADSGFFKIGITTGIWGRMDVLQCGNPRDLSLIALIPIPVTSEAAEVEAFLHEKFKDKSVRGEWFDLSEEQILDACKEALAIARTDRALQSPRAVATSDHPRVGDKLVYSRKETMAALGIGETTLWRLEKRKLILPVPDLRTKLYPAAEINRFLARARAA